MRIPTLRFVVLLATIPFAPLGAQQSQPLGSSADTPATCGASLSDDDTAEWLTESPLVADFTLDREDDAVLWGVADARLVLLVDRCEGGEPVERWRFPLELGEACDVRAATVAAGSLLVDDRVVERVCSVGEQRDECIHLRRENARRQALVDAGAREIRIDGPACAPTSLVWDEQRGGFMRVPR